MKADTKQERILSVLREKRVVFLGKTKEYSSDCPYARKISGKLQQTCSAAAFISLIARRSFGLAKSCAAQNLVKPRP